MAEADLAWRFADHLVSHMEANGCRFVDGVREAVARAVRRGLAHG